MASGVAMTARSDGGRAGEFVVTRDKTGLHQLRPQTQGFKSRP